MNNENNADARGLREAIIGFDNDAHVLFYYPEDVKRGGGTLDFGLDSRSAEDPAFPGEPTPLLALKPGGSGLWFDQPSEWAMEGAEPNGWVAFTDAAVAQLLSMTQPGDLLVLFQLPCCCLSLSTDAHPLQ